MRAALLLPILLDDDGDSPVDFLGPPTYALPCIEWAEVQPLMAVATDMYPATAEASEIIFGVADSQVRCE